MTHAETGELPGGFPYVRVGDGPRTLVVLPGVDDAMFGGEYPPTAGWTLRAYFARYLEEFTVYVVSRPRRLPEGYTARDSADGHARAIAEELGAVDVMGISTGGMIASELAAAYPDLVDRLVLVDSGYRIADDSRDDVRRLRRYALEHDWPAIRAELARAMFADWRSIAYPPIVLTVGRFFLPRPAVPADVWITLDLILEYDGMHTLEGIGQPTFVFAGTRDPYFTEPIVRGTASGIPNATLSLVPGAKHGAYHERKFTFDTQVTGFLDRSRPARGSAGLSARGSQPFRWRRTVPDRSHSRR